MEFQGQYGRDISLVSVFVFLAAVPTLIFYLFAERQIVAGLKAGAVKKAKTGKNETMPMLIS